MTDEALKPCPFTAVSRLYRTIEPTYTRIGLDATNSPGFRSLLSNVETIRAALEKAAAYDRIKPLLDELVAARELANPVHNSASHTQKKSYVFHKDAIGSEVAVFCQPEHRNDAKFYITAARIAKELGEG